MIRIVSPYFVAGAILENNKVIHVAPIIGYMKGWTREMVENYCKKKNWLYELRS